MADITRETIGLIRRVKEELKLARMRLVAKRKWLGSTDGVDIKITLVAVVVEAIALLTTGITAEIADAVGRGWKEAQWVAWMGWMGDELRQLTAGCM